MISSIDIRDVATYKQPFRLEPKDINFIYGGNGTGKTTLSRILSEDIEGDYDITWYSDEPLKTLAFNREFVKRNFSSGINGIFTLGEDDAESLKRLSELRIESVESEKSIASKKRTIASFEEKKVAAFSLFEEACWSQKKAFAGFPEALQGSISSKRAFAEACLRQKAVIGTGKQSALEDLSKRHAALYRSELNAWPLISFDRPRAWLSNEDRNLLAESIVGSSDTPIGAFIGFLQNSNWVKEGIGYSALSDGKCPFCQQELPEDLLCNLESYFDERYEWCCKELESLKTRYVQIADALESAFEGYLSSVPPGYDDHGLKSTVSSACSLLQENIRKLDSKLSDPSLRINLTDESECLERVVSCVESINANIDENNKLVANLNQEKETLNQAVWSLILYNLKGAFEDYSKAKNDAQKAIDNIQGQVKALSAEEDARQQEIGAIESARTSIGPTVAAINELLERFGFKGFCLAEDSDNEGMYKIVRPDGGDAKETLSEGEYNFISFLYFYHLVYGSFDKSGINEPRVVIIDDPISSLDSNVMFIVTTLTKEIVKDCRDRKNGIRQVFVLTHNVYFHKEATFLGSRDHWPSKRTLFWVINKMDESSSIEISETNPISTAYELLWGEVRDIGGTPNKNIFNTMRRILEYYFNVVGGWDYEQCIDSFDGTDKVICKALVACINEGSHMVTDDFVMCFSAEAIESYRRVFEKIFEASVVCVTRG